MMFIVVNDDHQLLFSYIFLSMFLRVRALLTFKYSIDRQTVTTATSV